MAAFAQPTGQQPPAATPAPTVSQPAATMSSSGHSSSGLPNSLYDVVLDLPHPGSNQGGAPGVQIFYPPSSDGTGNGIVDTLPVESLLAEFGPETIGSGSYNDQHQPTPTTAGAAKIARFAFPEYEDRHNATEVASWQAMQQKFGWNECNSGNLNKFAGYLEDVYSLSVSGTAGGTNASASGGAATTTAGAGGAQTTNGANHNYASNSTPTTNSTTPSSALTLPSYHVFSHKLSNGCTIHGHVRRYLPYHNEAEGRRDVGRRSERALIILTRNAGGGGRLYLGLLKSLEMLLLLQHQHQQGSTQSGEGGGGEETPASESASGNGDRAMKLNTLLQTVHQEHMNLCRNVTNAMMQQQQPGQPKQPPVLAKPRILTLPLMELGRGHGLFGNIDVLKFAVPPSFLHGNDNNGSAASDPTNGTIAGLARNDLLPMLRSLGVPRTMRLLSALMSEQRVIFTSSSAAKLSAVAYGSMSMMGQGLLSPPSVFVPVLPPGLASLLSTPSPYVIGVLTGSAPNYINLRSVPNIGEVVLFDLDNVSGNEPYFHNIANPQRSVPDLTRRNVDDLDMAAARVVSVADVLYQDLTEVIKADKKLFWQGAVQEKLGAAAAKGKKAANAALKKGIKYFKNKSAKRIDSSSDAGGSERNNSAGDEDVDEDGFDQQLGGGNSLSKLVGKGNYAYEHGFSNVVAEEEARIAFAAFFVSLLGDLRTYLTQQAPSTPLMVDKQKFMKYRAANGDTPGSGMFILIGNFLRGQIFDFFAAARLNEVQLRRVVPEDAPLFALVTNHHRLNKIDFSMQNVRQIVRQVATNTDLPGRYVIQWNRSIRNRVLEMTSAQTFQGDFRKALSEVTENCRESSTILIDTMMALWTRIQEGKGLQWKKALLALQILRHLLLNGPINVVAEAIDGFGSVRILKSYTDAMRAQNSKLVRELAVEVYTLLVDLPVLFARRRELMNMRRMAKDPKPSPLQKETRMLRGMIGGFRNIHIALKPSGATVAPAPPPVNDLLTQSVPSVAAPAGMSNPADLTSSAPPSGNYSNDLLSMSVMAAPTPQVPATSVAGVQQPQPSSAPQSGNYSNDLLAMSFGPTPAPQVGMGGEKKPDPFNMQAMSQATPTVVPSPTTNVPLTQPTPPHPAPQTQLMPPNMAMSARIPSQPMPAAPSQRAMPQQQQQQPRISMNPSPMTAQPVQTLVQPNMNATFPMPNSAQSQHMQHQQQQQSQTVVNAPVMNQPSMMPIQPAQGGNFQMNHNQPMQQPPPYAQNNITTGPPQNFGYTMQQPGAPSQFQQGTQPMMGMNPYPQTPGMPQNTNMNTQQK